MDLNRYKIPITLISSVLPIVVILVIILLMLGGTVGLSAASGIFVIFLFFFSKLLSLIVIYYFVYDASPVDPAMKRMCITSVVFLSISAIYGFNIPFFLNNLPAIAVFASFSLILGVIVVMQTMSIRLNGMYSGNVTNNLVIVAFLNLIFETPLILVVYVFIAMFFSGTYYLEILLVGFVTFYWSYRIYLNYAIVSSTDLIFARNRKKSKSSQTSLEQGDYTNSLTNK